MNHIQSHNWTFTSNYPFDMDCDDFLNKSFNVNATFAGRRNCFNI